MKSWLASGIGQNYGKELATGVIGELAWQLLGVAGLIAFAVAAIRYSIDRSQKNPFRVLAVVFGLGMLLQLYGFLTDAIDTTMRSAAERVSKNGAFESFSQTFMDGVTKRFSINVTQSSPTAGSDSSRWDKIKNFWDSTKTFAGAVKDDPENVATQYVSGALSGILSTLTVFFAIVFFELFSILRVALYQVLYAVGPLVIAFAVLPGALSVLGRWISAVFEVCSWQLIGAIVFELVAKSAAAHVYASSTDNFVALCVANLVFVCAIMLIPVIAHRIVGSGFSAIGQSIQSTVMSGAGGAMGAAVAGVTGGASLAQAAAPYVVKGGAAIAGRAVMSAGSAPQAVVNQPGVRDAMLNVAAGAGSQPSNPAGVPGAPQANEQPGRNRHESEQAKAPAGQRASKEVPPRADKAQAAAPSREPKKGSP